MCTYTVDPPFTDTLGPQNVAQYLGSHYLEVVHSNLTALIKQSVIEGFVLSGDSQQEVPLHVYCTCIQ